MTRTSYLLYILLFSALSASMHAQVQGPDELLWRGDSLRHEYEFDASIKEYRRVLETLTDSAARLHVEDRILLSENGKAMTDFVYSPRLVAKERFSIRDFYLHYPLKNRSWHPLPNVLDSVPGPFVNSLYAPAGDNVIYYSAAGKDGIRNIHMITLKDTIWTLPELVAEQMTSTSDEIYPMLSNDGKSLFFSSAGLYGVGGYDIYVSHWNEELKEWSVPVNMGFPYSSPADDFLFAESEDGSHTVFASNRECSRDSVWVYAVEYETMPVRRPVTHAGQLRSLAALSLPHYAVAAPLPALPEDGRVLLYMQKAGQISALKDSISFYGEILDEMRDRYAVAADAAERAAISDEIIRNEMRVPVLQSMMDETVKELHDVEMELLLSGVVIDPDVLSREESVAEQKKGFAFADNEMGEGIALKMMTPEPVFDYSFKILPVGQFAENNELPSGIIYQIQIFSTSSRVSEKSLKGLSPVFEHRTASGRYNYRVGLFRSYKDVLANLNAVKKVGFRSAFIVAFSDGKEISVSNARNKEKKEEYLFKVRIIPAGGELDQVSMGGIVQQAGGKDVAKVTDAEGGASYVIGPFDDKAQAETLEAFVKAMGIGTVSIEQVIRSN